MGRESIAGGNRHFPTFVILMQKLKLSYVLIKALKGFGTEIKNKIFLLLEKILSIHYFSAFGEFYLVKKQKPLKKSWMDPLGKGSDKTSQKYRSNLKSGH